VTKSKGIGRGGARPGAGRKRKLGAVEIEAQKDRKPETIVRSAARIGGKAKSYEEGEKIGLAPDEIDAILQPGRVAPPPPSCPSQGASAEPKKDDDPDPEDARSMKGLALAGLRRIVRHSVQDGAVVAAAKEILARGDAEEAAAGGGTGKKAARKAAAGRAVESGGKFAPRPAPGAGTRTLQ
jgi:hypothetical protein